MVTRSFSDAEAPPRGYKDGGGLVPVPDPTLLTTALVDKAISNLESKLQTRFDAMDKAADLLHADYTRVPTEMDRQIMHLRELMEGKIRGITETSNEKFARIDALRATDQTALTAALQSADKAVSKTEVNTADTIKQLQIFINNQNEATNAKIDDVKSRLDKGEGVSRGNFDTALCQRDNQRDLLTARSVQHSGNQNLIAMITAGIGLVGVLAAIGGVLYTATRPVPLAPAVVYSPPPGTAMPKREIFPERLRISAPREGRQTI